MNKKHSLIKKELSRCYTYILKTWHEVIAKNNIDIFLKKLTILNFGSRRVKRQYP